MRLPILEGEGEESQEGVEEVAGIPTCIEDMLSYKGVGPKIAYLTFSIAWGRDEGICVDTHVHRIGNRLRWVGGWPKVAVNGAKGKAQRKGHVASTVANGDTESAREADTLELPWKNTASPEKTRLQLQKLLPRSHWGKVNELLVGFGQTVCNAKKPMCHACELQSDCAHYMSLRESGRERE